MNDISRLALHLRENGEKILNLGHKLVLTVPVLHRLNESFLLIVENQESSNPSSFQVVNTNNSKHEIFHDLAFLHDFLQMTVSLKLTNVQSRVDPKAPVVIDISKFKVLKSLELRKVPIHEIAGLQHFRDQLHSIVCIHCLENLESILINCGADNSSGLAWSELREADFSYNELYSLDLSLNYVPWLQILDLSHNRLTNAEAVICLPNLICLNLSYNLLTSVPTLHKCARVKLQTLGVKYNNVEDLSELTNLENLTHLDLSCNCLMNHNDLHHLLHLPMLTWLSLKGNPLSFHKKHRLRAARCLHTSVNTRKFVLDLFPLSNSEQKAVGKMSTVHVVQQTDALTPPIQISEAASNRSFSHSPPRPQSSRRSGRVRQAVISELDGTAETEPENMNISVISSLEISTEHLETKKQIESLRERFGEENWLHSSGGSRVQDILGLPQCTQQTLSTTPCSRTQFEDQANLIHQAILSDMPVQEIVAAPVDKPVEQCTQHVAAAVESVSNEMETSTDSVFGSKCTLSEMPEEEQQAGDDEDESEKAIFLVEHLKSPGEGLFLVVTKQSIKEKEAGCGRTLEQWALASLMSAVRVSNMPITVVLSFRTVRRDRQERSYVMEDKDAQELVDMLNEVLASQILSFMKSFCCMKCSTQFSTEVNIANTDPTTSISCPTCQSTYVIEMDEVPLPEKQTNNNVEKPAIVANNDSIQAEANGSLANSPSQCSIGSAASLDPSPEGSSATGSTVPGRSDSDVEVISNPSQSSIEVLEETRRDIPSATSVSHSSRTQLLSLMGLTESSSSGSFTDSVCTTYENHLYLPLPKDEVNVSADETTVFDENTDLDMEETTDISLASFTSILDGLLYNLTTKISPTYSAMDDADVTKGEDGDKVRYNFLDFAQVDHRVKLHLYLQVFKDKNEELLLLVRGHIVPASTASYPGCIVISNYMVYLMQVAGFEGDDPDLWLVKQDVHPLTKLKAVQVLPWRQGVCLEFQDTMSEWNILVLLQDIQRTTNLLNFLNEITLPERCQIVSTLSVKHKVALQQLWKSLKPSPLQQLTIFTSCKVTDGCGALVSSLSFGFLFIMETVLVLSDDNLHWLFPHSTSKLETDRIQNMSNLIQVQISKLNLILEFLNETNSFSSVEVWIVEIKTVDSLQQVIAAIRKSWEELFAVPLHVTESGEIQMDKICRVVQ